MHSPIRAVFVGDGSLLVRCVDAFREAGHAVVRVASADDGVLAWASGQGLPTERVREAPAFEGDVFDILFSVGWLHRLPTALLQRARRLSLNFHDGPLPRYGGLNVTSWALLEGARSHGVTWHEATPQLDAGRIARALAFELSPDETAYSLNAHCYEAGFQAFLQLLDDLKREALVLVPPAGPPRLYRRDDRPPLLATLDWRRPASVLEALVRALDFGGYPNPLALPKLWCRGRLLGVRQARALAVGTHDDTCDGAPAAPGTVLAVGPQRWRVRAGEGVLELGDLQALDGGALPQPQVGERLERVAPAIAERLGQAQPALARAEAHWRAMLADAVAVPQPFPVRAQGAMASAAEAVVDVEIDVAVEGAARVLAGLAAWLSALTGQERISVAYRDAALARACEGLQAYASAWVPLTLLAGPAQLAPALCLSAQEAIAQARAAGPMTRDLPLRLRRPGAPGEDEAAAGAVWPWVGLSVDVAAGEPGAGPADTLALELCCDAQGRPRRLRLDARRWLLPAAREIAAQLAQGLHAFASHDGPLARLSLLTPADEGRRAALNRTAMPVDLRGGAHHAVERAALERPQAQALVWRDTVLTHEALQARVRALSAHLRQRGVRPGDVVGICLPRSPDLVVAVLAALRCGAAYLPLDPAYPRERLRFMRADAQASWVVGDRTAAALLDVPAAQMLPPGADVATDTITDVAVDVAADVGPDAVAYLIYTSGSTGQPKGVEVTHGNLLNFFAGMDVCVPCAPEGRWLAVTSLSFDISVLELLWTLSRGFTVVIDDAQEAGEGTDAGDGPAFSLAYFASGGAQGAGDYRLLLEGARFADRHGFAAVWTPERHFHEFGGPYPNPAITSAALATVTRRVQLRAGSCVLPLHHPLRVAEDWALVDNLCGGRVGISFAAGWQPQDFVLAPQAFAQRKQAMFEGIATLRRLWRGERLAWPGPDGQPVQVGILPRPVQPELPAWVTTAGNPDTFAEAGRAGCHVLTHLLGQTVEDLTAKVEAFRQAWRAAGHPGRGQVAVMVHAFVGDDEAQVRELARPPLKAYLRSSMDLIRRAGWRFPTFMPPGGNDRVDVDAPQGLPPGPLSDAETEAVLEHAFDRYWRGSALIGAPQRCLALVRRLQEAGVDEVACLIDFGIDADTVLAHLPRLHALMAQARPPTGSSGPTRAARPGPAAGGLALAAQMQRHRITHLQCTPSMATLLVADAQGRAALSRLSALLVGGEALPLPLARELRARVPGRLLNMYGPTETTVWSTCATLERLDDSVPLGVPIANTTLQIRNAWGQECPALVAGELWIGGAGVARGYRGQPELTAQRFVADPERPGARVYRTGDRVRRHPDGRLEFLGRMDHQVKVRGHRIELGEVEAALARQPGVREAVVVARPDPAGGAALHAFVTPRDPQQPPPAQALSRGLADLLPAFMQPQTLAVRTELPRTPNGKVDRQALQRATGDAAPVLAASPSLPPVSTSTVPPPDDALAAARARVLRAWREVLGRDDLPTGANFFDVGGHSLAVVQVQRRLREATGVEIAVVDMFRMTTVDAIADHLASRLAPLAVVPAPETVPATGPEPAGPADPPHAAAPSPAAVARGLVRAQARRVAGRPS